MAKGAKGIAQEMANAVNSKSHFFGGFIEGAISFPVDMGYLAYDFITTDSGSINRYDAERMLRLIKAGLANQHSLTKIVKLVVDEYLKKVDVEKVKKACGEFGSLYFLAEPKTKPFEQAIEIWRKNRGEFNRIAELFWEIGVVMKVFSVLMSRVIIGISYAVITMTLLCIAYFTLLSDSSYHIVYAIFSCIGFVLAYFIYYIAIKFHDGV